MAQRVDTGADAIYDTGFTSHAPRSNLKLERDDQVVALWQMQVANPSIYDNWQFKEQVLTATARLLFPLAPWVLAQRSNTLHPKHALMFVRDLAKVALGLERDMSVRNRMIFMQGSVVAADPQNLHTDLNKLDYYLPMAIVEQLEKQDPGVALANLADTPEKLRELMQSLYVMFGTGR